ncbi:hypothetical protein [Paenibacillus macerans]|uniref:hypothetical protein n=1 Tax=Paenibacillus macerans TaxID=44252 RepID=UPI000EE4DBA2|nr:hypothetical protein [Paenibacillus macerans]GBK64832.1 hypothetical protein PbDSM24746_48360 [Paenibacillus macerans]GBK70733.1 hypothetical protein PbJCM17693_44410 [Paenibacillus macerans]
MQSQGREEPRTQRREEERFANTQGRKEEFLENTRGREEEQQAHTPGREEERTGFQEGGAYGPSYDLQTDFVMVYGIDESTPRRIREWTDRGYRVHLMTGVSWGGYQDYLNGKVDGRSHWDEAQKYEDGETIIHGTSADIPYMVPTIAYADFLAGRIRPAVDAGVDAIHLEEPEFWVEGGYSEAFKREWQNFYNEPWIAPHASEDAQYRASKLKAYLYARCLDRICSALKEYSLVRCNRPLRFFVPTHSLINYAQWRIVSPESKLLDLPSINGYIAQIWTGTSRTANVYEGKRAERTFETAFLEYGIMQELVRGTDRRMWFLHDPIEDDPKRTWADYRENYIKTLTASLLHPEVSRYEAAPWPRRVFEGRYPSEDGSGKEGIPRDYATVLLTAMHTLRDMEQADVEMDGPGVLAGVFLADSAMYQRKRIGVKTAGFLMKYDGTNEVELTDEDAVELLNFSAFYGLTLPLVKHGLPVRPVQLDNVRRFPGYLDGYRLLVLSYEFMKPEYPDLHSALAQWVREGGALVYVGDDSDPYHRVREWWNRGKRKYASPREHLFECLGLSADAPEGLTPVGDGCVSYLRVRPERFAESAEGAERLRRAVREALAALDGGESRVRWESANYFKIRRGPYVIASVMTESVSDSPLELKGRFVDLLDAGLRIADRVIVPPGKQALLYDLDYAGAPISERGVSIGELRLPISETRLPIGKARVPDGGEGATANEAVNPADGARAPSSEAGTPRCGVIAASSRIEDYTEDGRTISFTVRGPRPLQAVARVRCKVKPAAVTMQAGGGGDQAPAQAGIRLPFDWDTASQTLLVRYEHGEEKTRITIHKSE